MSEIADDEPPLTQNGSFRISGPRRRVRRWPDLEVLEEWSRGEKEQRSEGIRAKKISEPVLVGGRLRPSLKAGWHRIEEDAPYRFTYFNEEFAGTIHSQTISELLQPGQTFRELFVPDPPVLSDESDDECEEPPRQDDPLAQQQPATGSCDSIADARNCSAVTEHPPVVIPDHMSPPPPEGKQERPAKPKRYGARPTFWLDVLSPTEAEMKVISKTFAIHPLTSEDIMMQEAREKVELFRNYYFVNYRTFDQDTNSDHYLEPVNMYVVVFREGVISVCLQ
jgi:magnesium transporter